MRAIVQDRYGGADTLRVGEVPVPVPDETSVLIKVRAASINALDYRVMRGKPAIGRILFGFGLTRPKRKVRGVDVAGVVESAPPSVTQYKPGDEVFGLGSGSFAEYVAGDVKELCLKPPTLTYEQAAALPIAGITALQGLRDKAQLRPGQSILVIGAGGGVGTFTVQIARAMGARVTGVTSSANLDAVRSLGAERVVDYGREEFVGGPEKYDVIVDLLGNRPYRSLRRSLAPGGRIVVIGGRGIGRFVLAGLLRRILRYPVETFIARVRPPDLAELARLTVEGKVRPFIERTYALNQAPEAMRLADTHQARGKLVLTVSSGGPAEGLPPKS